MGSVVAVVVGSVGVVMAGVSVGVVVCGGIWGVKEASPSREGLNGGIVGGAWISVGVWAAGMSVSLSESAVGEAAGVLSSSLEDVGID